MTTDQHRFNALLAQGRELDAAERAEALQRLARSPQFPVLLALVREDWEAFGKAISGQQIAAHHGCMEHCAGSMYALELLEGKLRGAMRAPKAKEEGPGEEG